jgi:hypothetical protein
VSLRRAAVLAIVLGAAVPPALSAHDETIRVAVVLTPGQPRTGQPGAMRVSVVPPPGLALLDEIRGVRVTCEMTGHAMASVEATLEETTTPGVYTTANLTLTMAGPWKMTVSVRIKDEEMWAVFAVDAARASVPVDPAPKDYVLDLKDPVRANVMPPWWVLGVTLGLVAVLEATALVFKVRRQRAAAVQPY